MISILAQTYGRWAPPLFSEHGGKVDELIDIVHVFMLLLFVGWGLFFAYCLHRFRRRPGHQASYTLPKAKIPKGIEVFVAIFEAGLLLFLSMPVWASYKNDPPPKENRVEVNVISQQFQWNFHYAGNDGVFGRTDPKLISPSNPIGLVEGDSDAKDDIVTVGEMHLPTGKPVYVRLSSLDVIHSFFIPTMRVKQDAVPGIQIPIWFTVMPEAISDTIREDMIETRPIDKAKWTLLQHYVAAKELKGTDGAVVMAAGDDFGFKQKDIDEKLAELKSKGVTEITIKPRQPLEIVCAQLCGNSHYKMKASVITHSQADYDAWLTTKIEEKNKPAEDVFGF